MKGLVLGTILDPRITGIRGLGPEKDSFSPAIPVCPALVRTIRGLAVVR